MVVVKVDPGPRRPVVATVTSPRQPVITVIIATYNAVHTIEQAISSVFESRYDEIELIVIDGGSQDGTLDVVRKYEQNLVYWESRSDEGIYHALNKGLAQATEGSYVLVLGADDKLLSLVQVVETINRYDPDVVIANVRQRDIKSDVVSPYRCHLPSKVDEANFLEFPFHHQGFLFRKPSESLPYFKPFLGLHADYEFMARLVNSGARSVYVEAELAEYMTGGASDYFSVKNLQSLRAVAISLGFSPLRIALKNPLAVMRMMVKIVIGKRFIMYYRAIFSRRHKIHLT